MQPKTLEDGTTILTTSAGNEVLVSKSGALLSPQLRYSGSAGRWVQKAVAFTRGWAQKFGVNPDLNSVILGLAVAQHETACGDAWPGEYNWGACQRADGILNANEKAILAANKIVPSPKNVEAARKVLPVRPNAALHCDSSPRTGYYFVYFWAFSNDAEGASFFAGVLAKQRPYVKAALATGDAHLVAQRMYESHYYEGFHDPHKPGGAEANIQDYANALTRLVPEIKNGLGNWNPNTVPVPPRPPPVPSSDPIQLDTKVGVQKALNLILGANLETDGIFGPLTLAAIKQFQTKYGLEVDGIVGPITKAKLASLLPKT